MAFQGAIESYRKQREFIKSARDAGVDPRTIEYYETARKEASAAQRRYEATLRKKKRGIAGAFRRLGGGGTIEKYRDLAQKARLEVEDLRKGLLSDIAKQGELQAIRRKRKSAVEETIAGMTRKRGKASLLSSPAGGAGFFERYFT